MNLSCIIIDDEPNAVNLLEMLIRQTTQWQLLAKCYDALEAIGFLKTHTVDFIFLDINMPVMNGWELLYKLKKDNNYNDIPVIIYTTSSEQRDKEIAKDLGALCFVTKPDNFRLMKSILKVVVDNLDKNSLDDVCTDIENVLHKQ